MKSGDWNYRLFKHDDGEVEIVEVIYGIGETGMSWSEMFPIRAADIGGLSKVLVWLALAFEKPTLDRTSFNMDYCCDEHINPADQHKRIEETAAALRADMTEDEITNFRKEVEE